MGMITPNMSIYTPAAGETNYDASFAAGMLNVDQHDHSGPPTKGVPINSSGIAAGSITFDKLNPNVADNTTGIGTSLVNLNQLIILGVLKSIFQISTTAGFLAKNGTNASALTFQNNSQTTWTSPDGTAGNPSVSLNPTFFDQTAFTPGIKGSTGAGANVYTTQYGFYQVIGNMINVYGYVKTATSSGMTGLLEITGLPFPLLNNVNYSPIGGADPGISIGLAAPAGGTYPFIRGNQGTTNATLAFYDPTTGNDLFFDAATWPTAIPQDIAFQLTYFTA